MDELQVVVEDEVNNSDDLCKVENDRIHRGEKYSEMNHEANDKNGIEIYDIWCVNDYVYDAHDIPFNNVNSALVTMFRKMF